jgi:hypothetical protein
MQKGVTTPLCIHYKGVFVAAVSVLGNQFGRLLSILITGGSQLPVMNTLGSHDSTLMNTLMSFDSPVVITLGSRL